MPWKELCQLGGAAVVAIAAFYFGWRIYTAQANSNKEWGESRDREREEFLKRLDSAEKRQEDQARMFTGAIVSLVSLAHTMVGKCQGGLPAVEQITPEHILRAADQARNIGEN
jgi:hypothetical protein